MATTQIAGLSPTAVAAFTTTELKALNTSQFAALTAAQVAKVSTTDIAVLGATELANLQSSALAAAAAALTAFKARELSRRLRNSSKPPLAHCQGICPIYGQRYPGAGGARDSENAQDGASDGEVEKVAEPDR